MSKKQTVLGIIMAGGKGERLYPLTNERSKPSVPFAGKLRIIDFVLSNFLNSGIRSSYVLVQYRSQSLIEHLRTSWPSRGLTGDHFITVVPPQMKTGESWYRGTADAVTQNLNLILDFKPDLIAIFGADHIYRMDIQQMIDFHNEREAAATVAALPVPIEQASGFGIIESDENGKILGFEEKPAHPKPMPKDSSMAFSSMGNYIFNADVLIDALLEDERRMTEHDFGRTIMPELCATGRVHAYNFKTNNIPGSKDYEEKGYWRDVGTLSAYWAAHMDLLGETPRFDLLNPQWPIFGSRYEGPSARIIGGAIDNSIVGEGSVLQGATIKNCVLGRGVMVFPGTVISDSIIMDHTVIGANAKLTRVICDRYNHLPDGTVIGDSRDEDGKRFVVDPSGIVVVPRGRRI